MKFLKYKIIKGSIKLETGLHIGGSSDRIEIGGLGSPVIKHPVTNEPYIPGSSIKGKMRSLLEWKLNKIDKNDGEPHQWCKDKDCPICRIFGTSSDKANIGPTRLIVRDAFLDKKQVDEYKKKGILFTEDKVENTINRITAKANPRHIERAIPGLIFNFEIVYKIIEADDSDMKVSDEKLFNYVEQGLQLIENDTLGGSGSRGYGKVKFDYEITEKTE